MCDIALDPYTSHGHDGIIINNKIDNIIEIFNNREIIGEITIVIKGLEKSNRIDLNKAQLKKELDELINAGLSLSAASKYLAKKKNLTKNLIYNYNLKYNLKKINKIHSFELKGLSLRSYFHKNILAFGDLLHRIHPLAGQGFNMTIRDIKILNEIILKKTNLGLPLDSTLNTEFENNQKHKNYIFSTGIDLIHEFFNFERKTKNDFLSKSIKYFNKNLSINKIFTKIADKGFLF